LFTATIRGRSILALFARYELAFGLCLCVRAHDPPATDRRSGHLARQVRPRNCALAATVLSATEPASAATIHLDSSRALDGLRVAFIGPDTGRRTGQFRRSVIAVAAKRESFGIPIFAPQRIRWSKREIELLGKRPDSVVARMLSRTRYAVQLKRHSLGIGRCWENAKPETKKDEAWLGTARDQEISRKLGRSVNSVRSRRLHVTRIKFKRTPHRWTTKELQWLGKVPDAEIVRRSDRYVSVVRMKRIRLSIPAPVSSKRRIQ